MLPIPSGKINFAHVLQVLPIRRFVPLPCFANLVTLQLNVSPECMGDERVGGMIRPHLQALTACSSLQSLALSHTSPCPEQWFLDAPTLEPLEHILERLQV